MSNCDLFNLSRKNSMCSEYRLQSLQFWVDFVLKNNIGGDFVECGVWRGGCSAIILHSLISARSNAVLWLFDTFQGMPKPTSKDVDFSSNLAIDKWMELRKNESEFSDWCAATLESVQSTLADVSDDYKKHCNFVIGKVEETLLNPINVPDKICLLRLDTDWYESTRAELETLFPLVSNGGVIIIDDYCDWQGARIATDEFLMKNLQAYPCKQQIADGSLVLIKI